MNGMKATGKTIGEVEKLTGILKRDLKYFIEQGLVQPSQKSGSGYWLYSEKDIKKVQLTALCRELDFPVRAIRVILSDPARCWLQELEEQIVRLLHKKDRAEAQLAHTELLRLNWRTEAWASLIES